MKTITITSKATEVNALLEQARDEDLLVQAPDGTAFMLTAIDDFDEEIARTLRNPKLMALLDERSRQPKTIPLAEAKRLLGLDE
jgi:hypothetical protein